MAWTIKYEEGALKDLKQLDKSTQRRILDYLKERVANSDDPKKFGKPLTTNLKGLWRYRIGDYRVVCRFRQKELIVLVISVGHRRLIYNKTH